MLCGMQAKGLSYQATSKMLERQANNVLKCRQRAWLSRLMSWRTLTSNTHTHTQTCFKRLNWVSGTSQLRQPLTALPLSSSPFRQYILVARLFGICSVIRVLSAYAKGATWQYWLQIELCTFSSPFYAPSIMRRVCCAHTNTHTHTRARNQLNFYPC